MNYRETYIVDRLVTELDENIHASDGTFYVYVQCRSALHWTHANRQLAGFATVHQDGDDEGVLVLFRMPDESEAATLRHYIGLQQTREVPPERAQKYGSTSRRAPLGRFIVKNQTG